MANPDQPAPTPSRQVEVGQRQTQLGHSPGRLFTLSGPVVGIDFGTVNSCVAAVRNGEAQVLTNPGGYPTVPTIVHLPPGEPPLVGHPARERMILEPDRAVYGAKRFLGRPFASREVAGAAHFYNYELVQSPEGRVAAQVDGQVISLEEVAAQILTLLRKVASHALGQDVQRAVVTVPAYFGETQRQAVRDAGRIAGLYVERILNEPTAAAVAFGFNRGLEETVLVYDLGGGTFDASVLRIAGNRMEVLASDGDPFLGGSDLDDRITEFLLQQFEREHGFSLREQTVSVQRIRFAAESAKKTLSDATTAHVHLPFIAQSEAGPVDLRAEITREQLEMLTNDLVERTLTITQKVLDQAQVRSSDLNDVILVGGQSRSPAVRQLLTERFGKKPCSWVHPDEAVAIGAALVAHAIEGAAPMELTDVLSASIRLGLKNRRTAVLIPRGVRLPAEKKFEVTLSGSGAGHTKVFLYRGEGAEVVDNSFLGTLMLPGVPADAEGKRKAIIVLTVSADGLLSVQAQHPSLGSIAELDVLLL